MRREGVSKEEAGNLYCFDRLRPSWRGVMHRCAFATAPLWCYNMLTLARSAPTSLSVCIFLFAMVGLFGASSSYHRNNWSVTWERFMGKLDYTFIFFVVGFTYVPVYTVLLPSIGWYVVAMLAVTVMMGAILSFADLNIGRHSLVLIYIAQAIIQLIPFAFHVSEEPNVFQQLTTTERWAFYLMGASYLVGSQIYAYQWPNPLPKTFGYHEIWHLLIVVAASCSYYINASVLARFQ